MADAQLHGVTAASRRAMSVRDQVTLSLYWFALNFQSGAFLAIVIPAQILVFVAPGSAGNTQQALFLGWLSLLGGIAAAVAQPVVGKLSDRPLGALRGRRPYIALGTALLIIAQVVLSEEYSVWLFVAAYLATQLGSNASTAAYQALLPDRVPEDQRGSASGFMGLMTMLGTVGSLGIAGLLLSQASVGRAGNESIRHGAALYYLASNAILAVAAFITLFGVRESVIPAAARPTRRTTSLLVEWLAPWRHTNFVWVFLTRSFVMAGISLFLTFIEYFFASVLHISDFVGATVLIALLALLGALVSSIAVGALSDYVRRVPLVGTATLCMALPALLFVLFPNQVPLWPLGLVFGLGYGAYISVDWALAVDSLPSRGRVGQDFGIWSLASTIPAVTAPFLGSLIIRISAAFGSEAIGYRLIFAAAMLCFLAGAVFIQRVQELEPAL